MDLVPHMAQLKAAGVASIKIEGRLRTPEYAAAAVTACCAARAGQPYDEALLRDIFSRSGFSDAYLAGRNDGTMFGVRTEADAAATRAATPKARELFRRELERIPVHFCVSGGVEDGGIKLTAFDDNGSRVNVYSADEPQPAQKDPAPGIERALGKTGGTPFTCAGVEFACGEGGPGFLPGSAWNEMRREALDKLLQKRSEPAPLATKEITLPEYAEHEVGMIPQLTARFETAAQLPGAEYLAKLRYLILPHPGSGRCAAALALQNAAGAAPRCFRHCGTGYHAPPGCAGRFPALRVWLQTIWRSWVCLSPAGVRRAGAECNQPNVCGRVCVPGCLWPAGAA